MARGGAPDRPSWTLAGWVLLVGVGLGAIESAKALAIAELRGIPFGLRRAVLTNMPWWVLWVPLAFAVFALARRIELRHGAIRWVASHAAMCAVLSLMHIALSAVFVWRGALPPPGATITFGSQFRTLLAGYLLTDFVTYAAILAGYTAWASRERIRATEAERARLELAAAEAEAEKARLKSQMTEARLRALRSELDPHFLFNSLHSVGALVQRGEGADGVRVVARLAELLRRTLDGRDEPEATLGEELDLLALYLEIETVRFRDRLSTCIEVDPRLRRALVPSLILQPLVENAIRHGVARTGGPVSVDVVAIECGGRLSLSVRDTGPGPGAAQVTHARRAAGIGLGLRNVRERLSALYGDEGSFALLAREGGGAEAVVTLPLHMDAPVVSRHLEDRAAGVGS